MQDVITVYIVGVAAKPFSKMVIPDYYNDETGVQNDELYLYSAVRG